MIFSVSKDLPEIYHYAADLCEHWLYFKCGGAILDNTSSPPGFFTHTDKSVFQVASYIAEAARLNQQSFAPECRLEILRVPWQKKWAYRNTIAEHSYGKISFHKKFLKRDLADVVNTIVHEYMHYIGFSHKGNKPTPYNLRSVPYVVGSLAEAWVRGGAHGR